MMVTFAALLGLIYCTNSYILSGYICPTCPSAKDPTSLIANVNSAYNRVIIAFIVWDENGYIINQYDDPSKKFTLTKQMVSNLQSKGVQVLISIGGGAGPPLNCATCNNPTFVNNFISGILNITTTYGFDGVDFDIEHRNASDNNNYVACDEMIAGVMNTLYANKLVITMAPQMPNLFPQLNTVSSGVNELAPLIGMVNATVIQSVQVQMYNTWAQAETVAFAEKYVKEIDAGYNVTTQGKTYYVEIPPSQLLLGYPATRLAAGTGYIDPSKLKSMYETLVSEGYTISGFMTWSIGYDAGNNWEFADTLGNL